MPSQSGDWSTQQLAEFVAAVSAAPDVRAAMRGAVDRATEAFEAEIGAIIHRGEVPASIGFPAGAGGRREMAHLGEDPTVTTEVVPGIGSCLLISSPIGEGEAGRIVVARAGDDPFTPEERNLLRAMGRVLGVTLQMLERQKLLERLSKIQRSISHRAPLQEVLDAITQGAADLIDVDVVGLRVLDPDEPGFMRLVSSSGVPDDVIRATARTAVGEGAGGQAIFEDRPVVIDDYDTAPGAIRQYADDGLTAAMAVAVHESGRTTGSLTVASRKRGRRFSETEREVLEAFADHASAALADAKTVAAMREAQRSREMFLAMVSHELKTPLTVMMGTLRTLQAHGDSLPDDIVSELLTTAFDRGRDLGRLIDRLLQGAQAELAGVKENILLPELVRTAVSGLSQLRRIDVEQVPDDVVFLDRAAVIQVFGVLLENALAHSPEGGRVAVSVGLDRKGLSLSVTNEGALPGDLEVDALFQPFQRGAGSTAPGVGLGLYIGARVAESIGGAITASSSDGFVRFTLSVPVDLADEGVRPLHEDLGPARVGEAHLGSPFQHRVDDAKDQPLLEDAAAAVRPRSGVAEQAALGRDRGLTTITADGRLPSPLGQVAGE